MKTIGYYGDSFCADSGVHSWCTLLADRLESTVVNYGLPGRSIWTAILDFEKIKSSPPDFSIFCWTDPYRLYHDRLIANHLIEVNEQNKEVVEAARMYKLYLSNQKKEHIEYEYVLKYFDKNVLKPLEHKTQIYQCWSFKPFELVNKEHNIQLTTGKVDDISLYQYSNKQSGSINHMDEKTNVELANRIYRLL